MGAPRQLVETDQVFGYSKDESPTSDSNLLQGHSKKESNNLLPVAFFDYRVDPAHSGDTFVVQEGSITATYEKSKQRSGSPIGAEMQQDASSNRGNSEESFSKFSTDPTGQGGNENTRLLVDHERQSEGEAGVGPSGRGEQREAPLFPNRPLTLSAALVAGAIYGAGVGFAVGCAAGAAVFGVGALPGAIIGAVIGIVIGMVIGACYYKYCTQDPRRQQLGCYNTVLQQSSAGSSTPAYEPSGDTHPHNE